MQDLYSITSKKANDLLKSSVNPYSLCSHSHFCLLSCLYWTLNLISISFPGVRLSDQDVTDRKFSPLPLTFPDCSRYIWQKLKSDEEEDFTTANRRQTLSSLNAIWLHSHRSPTSSPQPCCPVPFPPSPTPLLSPPPLNLCVSYTEWFNDPSVLLFHSGVALSASVFK